MKIRRELSVPDGLVLTGDLIVNVVCGSHTETMDVSDFRL